jgi:hypothetical protein
MTAIGGLVGEGVGGLFQGLLFGGTFVVGAMVAYTWVRGSGLPLVGASGRNGTTDPFGGY